MAKLLIVLTLFYIYASINCFHINSNSLEQEQDASSLKSLQNKLDLILDTENHEKHLLENLLFENTKVEDIKKLPVNSMLLSDLKSRSQNQVESGETLQEIRSGYKTEKEIVKPMSDFSIESTVQKLLENSQRMESMMVMLNDFKSILSQTISTQERQMGLKTEVIELREEINYLRQEIQKVKSQHEVNDEYGKHSKFQNKMHNDETTMNWLKESVNELRSEIIDVSSSLNVTGLLHLKQQLDSNRRITRSDFDGLQKRMDRLQLNSDQNSEAILEIRGDVADVRTWQVKMGETLVQQSGKLTTWNDDDVSLSLNSIDQSQEMYDTRLKILQDLESQKNIHSNDSSRSRHHHKRHLQGELKKVEKILMGILHDQNTLQKQIHKMELNKSSRYWEKVVENSYDGDEFETTTEHKKKRRRHRRQESGSGMNHYESYDPTIELRLSSLENSLADYSNSVQLVDDKVTGLSELHGTTKSLFTSLESLETKYDVKITDLQTTMAQVEAGMSSIGVATEELKEQQNLQNIKSQSLKKEARKTVESLQTTQLRVASLQNQILKWGMKLCKKSNAESIQEIKMASTGYNGKNMV